MTISELNQKYCNGELTAMQGDKEFRYLLLSPLFENLYENKVIYHERFTCVVRLENILFSPDMFEAIAVRHLIISGSVRMKKPIPEKWPVSANWGYMTLTGNCLSFYSGWLMWVDPVLVERVEKLVIAENFEEALKLTIRSV